jgi:hypothetical protein
VSSFDPRQLLELDPRALSTEEFRELLAAAVAKAEATDTAQSDAEADALGEIGPQLFARIVGRARRDQLDVVMSGEIRPILLRQVFRRFSDHYKAGEPRDPKVVHWVITGRADGGVDTWELVLRGDECAATDRPAHEPHTTLRLSGSDFVLVTSGNAKPTGMFLTGRVKVKGDLSLAMALSKLFDTPSR